jgi:transcriptional regulator with XRE-family HTH domain
MLEDPHQDGDEHLLATVADCTPDPGLERVARALRAARARTGLSEEQIVAMLGERGVPISLLVLRRAERIGSIDLALAARLADVYGMTTDTLAGRRPNSWQFAPPALSL